MKLDLGNVTLCAVGSHDRLLAARALDISNSHCKFADSILFSHEPVDGTFRNVKIERPPSNAAYTLFLLKGLNAHVQSPFVLVTQWDGYVTRPEVWTDEFLKYDYIGAIWGQFKKDKVGNGGFSLRSKRLLEVIADPQFQIPEAKEPPYGNEDFIICHTWKPTLEKKFGIRFAPEALAERFSYERESPAAPTFGFHGFFNFFREVGDSELQTIVKQMEPSMLNHPFCAQLAEFYFISQRWNPLRTLYMEWRSHFSFEQVSKVVSTALYRRELAPAFLKVCEAMLPGTRK